MLVSEQKQTVDQTKKKSKVIIIHNLLWTHYKAVVHRELYKVLKDTEIDIHILQVCKTRQIRANMGSVDLSLHNYPYTLLFDKSLEETTVSQRAKAILGAVLKMKPDVLIVSYADKAYLPTIFLSKIMGIKLIMNFNSNEIDQKRNFFSETFKKLMLKIPVNFFCYGTTQAEYVKKLGGDPNKITIRYQTTDINNFHAKLEKYSNLEKENIFLYVGRITKIKNLKFMVDAFAATTKGDWKLVIVGYGDELPILEKYIKDENISQVHFEGGKTQEEVIQYYVRSKVFVLPSLMEPWGLVANEAMICSLPILISNYCGCCADLVKENENGFSFDPKNMNSLKTIMQNIINDKYDLDTFGERSKEIISQYSPQTTASQMIAGIKSVL